VTARHTWSSAEAVTAHARDTLSLVSILARAREILAEPDRWTRVALSRSATRSAVLPTSDLGVSWSATGALALAILDVLGPYAPQSDRERLFDLGIGSLWQSLPDDQPRTPHMSLDIDGFNDYPGTHYRDVLDLYERALASARAPF
jgi:hypothetical protein